MEEYLGKSSQAAYAAPTAMVHMPTMKERLDQTVRDAEERLARAKEARAIFARNPDVERLLDIMQRGLF